MLQSRRRRRYGYSAVSAPSPLSTGRRRAMPLLFIALFVAVGIWLFLRFLAPGAQMRRVATMLTTDERGQVEFIIEGNETPQRAETGLELYEGERIRTDGVAHASLQFFDGTVITLDQNTSVLMGEALQGTEESLLALTLESGRIFVRSGTSAMVSRTIGTSSALHTIPAQTTTLIGTDAAIAEANEKVTVFQTTGQGIESSVKVGKKRISVITGEGQELLLSASGLSRIAQEGDDPYALRRVLDSTILSTGFYRYAAEEKESPLPQGNVIPPSEEPTTVDGQQLTVDEPKDGTLLDTEAVIIKGRVGSRVVTVRVNGYAADVSEGAYQKEIALPTEENFTVEVQAEDKDGLIIEAKSLALRRDIKPPEPPVIASPARRTVEDTASVPPPEPVAVQENEFEITGEALGDAVGVIVNGYRLQKFVPGKPWAYLVNGTLGNVKVGENTYEVVSVDRSGNVSDPVRIVILWRAQPVPTPDSGTVAPDDRTSLYPRSLRVIAPTRSTSSGQADGSAYETSEAEVLIEGETHPETATISVNGYMLSLYEAGKVTWNYIAKEEFGNFRTGTNNFTVVARNSEGRILDVVRYVIEKR